MSSAGSSSILPSECPPCPRSSLPAMRRRPIPAMATGRCSPASTRGSSAASPARTRRDLLGLPLMPYTQLRYVTCLDLGRFGAVITQGWERRVEKTGSEGKAVKRLINTQVIYPPADVMAEALLASSSTNLAERAGRVDGTKADLDPVPSRRPDGTRIEPGRRWRLRSTAPESCPRRL